jgi:23S rRNA G2445 N2-methylase RlmL
MTDSVRGPATVASSEGAHTSVDMPSIKPKLTASTNARSVKSKLFSNFVSRIRCSVPGFEDIAAIDMTEKLMARDVKTRPGYVEGSVDVDEQISFRNAIQCLRAAEHVWALLFVGELPIESSECPDGKVALALIHQSISGISDGQWDGALRLWGTYNAIDPIPKLLTFKVIKKKIVARAKRKKKRKYYSFTSTELGQAVFRSIKATRRGAAWTGVLDDPQLIIEVRVQKNRVMIGIPLGSSAIWKRGGAFSKIARNLSVRTPLKPTISYGVIKSAGGALKCGEVIVDPCCGSGTIGECAADEANDTRHPVFVISGDVDACALAVAKDNVRRRSSRCEYSRSEGGSNNVRPTSLIDIVQWDATRLPLRDGVIDRVATDLPFGKRCGSRTTNSTLYPALFGEVARILQATGSAAILSCDRENLLQGIRTCISLNLRHERAINIGGMSGIVAMATPDKV